MRPDIVVTRKSDGAVFVLNTKWKVLEEGKANYGIAQADVYQMYACQKKYPGARSITLLYPLTEKTLSGPIGYTSHDGVSVRVILI